MEITGIIFAVLPERQGTKNIGGVETNWRVASYVLQTEGNDPHYMTFDVFDGTDNRIKRLNIQQGKRMTIYFDIRAHEWQGRWFNQIRAYDAREVAQQPAQQQQAQQ